MAKTTILIAAGVGYVLGTRAGTERYDEIKRWADKVWRDPRVQGTAAQAQELMDEKVPAVQNKVAEVAAAAGSKTKKATGRVKSRAGGPSGADGLTSDEASTGEGADAASTDG